MSDAIQLQVHLAFDSDAKVWYVSKSDIPGLSLEADTPGALVQRVEASAPELIELNLQEIIDAHMAKAKPASINVRRVKKAMPRPHMSWLPIFDNSMELACA